MDVAPQNDSEMRKVICTASLKGQMNTFLCTQDICIEKFYVTFSHHISPKCFSGQQKDAEKFCVRSLYSFAASTLLCITVFSCGIFWKCQGGQGVNKLVRLFYIPKHYDFVLDHFFI